MDELKQALKQIDKLKDTPVIRSSYVDELMELLKKVTTIERVGKEAFWNGVEWAVYSGDIRLYRGDSLIEALKILTKED